MKKLLWLLFAGLMLFSLALAACGGSPATTPAASSPASTTLPPMNITVATDATWPPFEFVNEETKK